MKCFHTDEEEDAMPYELEFKLLQEKYIKKRVVDSIYEMF